SVSYLGSTVPDLPKPAIENVVITPDTVRFVLKFPGAEGSFDGKWPPDKNGKVAGSWIGLLRGNQLLLTSLEPSKLKSFDIYEFKKETFEQSTDAADLLNLALELVKAGGEKKTKVEEVRGWADKAFKAADGYGGRWQRQAALKLAQALAGQKDFAPVAVEYARKAERLLDRDTDEAGVQMEV